MESIHGHEVLAMMMDADRPLPREALVRAIGERFGADARFHTCAADDLTADGLLDFLLARGKFHVTPEGLSVRAERVCRDGEHDHEDEAA